MTARWIDLSNCQGIQQVDLRYLANLSQLPRAVLCLYARTSSTCLLITKQSIDAISSFKIYSIDLHVLPQLAIFECKPSNSNRSDSQPPNLAHEAHNDTHSSIRRTHSSPAQPTSCSRRERIGECKSSVFCSQFSVHHRHVHWRQFRITSPHFCRESCFLSKVNMRQYYRNHCYFFEQHRLFQGL